MGFGDFYIFLLFVIDMKYINICFKFSVADYRLLFERQVKVELRNISDLEDNGILDTLTIRLYVIVCIMLSFIVLSCC